MNFHCCALALSSKALPLVEAGGLLVAVAAAAAVASAIGVLVGFGSAMLLAPVLMLF